jgi:hypothetical protein
MEKTIAPFSDWSEKDLAIHKMSLEYHKKRNEMKNLAEELRKKYNDDLLFLQTTCDHPDVSEWLEYMWAPGHSSGYEVKMCTVCEKILWYRSTCHTCKALMITNTEPNMIWGNFCDACQGVPDANAEIGED